jgi:hypothetical protein
MLVTPESFASVRPKTSLRTPMPRFESFSCLLGILICRDPRPLQTSATVDVAWIAWQPENDSRVVVSICDFLSGDQADCIWSEVNDPI